MLKWLSRKDNSIIDSTLNQLAELVKWGTMTKSGRTINKNTALEIPAVFCACRVISEGIAQMPPRLRDRKVVTMGDQTRIYTPANYKHWAYRLMCVRPNDWMTANEFIEHAVFIAVLFGDFIAVKTYKPGKDAEVDELIPVPPGCWSVKQNKDYTLEYEVRDSSGNLVGTYKRADIFHLRGPSLDNYKGLPVIEKAREAIGLAATLEEAQSKFAASGARPSGVLSTERGLNKEKSKAIKEAWNSRFGANGEGGVALLDGGWKFEAMQFSSVDMQHIETRKFQIEEIARAFRVNPQMLMSSDKTSTYASAEQFFTAHVIHTLGPWVRRFESVVNRDILGNKDSVFFDLDERNLMRGSFKDQADYFAKALGSGGTPAWMTQNEVREQIGLQPSKDEDADRLFMGFQEDVPADSTDTGDTATEEEDVQE